MGATTTKANRFRGKSAIKLSALRRCIQAAADTGIPHRIEIDPGTGRIIMIPVGEPAADDLDSELAAFEGRHGQGSA